MTDPNTIFRYGIEAMEHTVVEHCQCRFCHDARYHSFARGRAMHCRALLAIYILTELNRLHHEGNLKLPLALNAQKKERNNAFLAFYFQCKYILEDKSLALMSPWLTLA